MEKPKKITCDICCGFLCWMYEPIYSTKTIDISHVFINIPFVCSKCRKEFERQVEEDYPGAFTNGTLV